MDFKCFLKAMTEHKASDLYVTVGKEPMIKVHGKLIPVVDHILNEADVRDILWNISGDSQRKEILETHEANFAISDDDYGRFRVSAFQQRGHYGFVARRIESRIPTVKELGLPLIINELAMTKRGLIIFVGATGSGKSSSLAAMIGFRNQNSTGHIISIEDPIEFVHQHGGCIVTQREVGIDTQSFDVALKNALRQAPDVILIGEIRSKETMENAIAFSETGHLCLATLHANNADQAMERIITFFPQEQHNQLLMELSLNLRAMIAQQLIPTVDGKGRTVAVEILINSPLMADLIRKGEIHEMKGLMKKSRELGMITFDQALFELHRAGKISYDEALIHADSQNELRLMVKLSQERKLSDDGPLSGVAVLD